LAFARVLLHKPDWLFLDEATSALDEATEGILYEMIGKRLSGTAVISVAHRLSLYRFHGRVVGLDRREDGISVMMDKRDVQSGNIRAHIPPGFASKACAGREVVSARASG